MRYVTCLTLFCLLFRFQFLTAQAPDTLWTKTFGGSGYECGNSVQQTTDEGYIITGWTDSFGSGDINVWLIKTDSSGDTLWTKTFGGINRDFGRSVRQTIDEGYIITGHTLSFGAGAGDICLIKIATEGTKIEKSEEIIPLGYSVHQNYPNPFNPTPTIAFDLPKTSNVTLKICNILGE
jgi:hypothetical protein